nr:hypothetical protein [Tanacetum cinerariifolium]
MPKGMNIDVATQHKPTKSRQAEILGTFDEGAKNLDEIKGQKVEEKGCIIYRCEELEKAQAADPMKARKGPKEVEMDELNMFF